MNPFKFIIVEMWCNFNYHSVDYVITTSHRYPKVIWGNSNIQIGNIPVYWNDFRYAELFIFQMYYMTIYN